MNSIQLLHKIQLQINEISKINEQLISENNSANEIDIALLKQQCVALYETILKLKSAPQTEIEETPKALVEKTFKPTEVVDIINEKEEQNSVSMEEFEIKEAEIFSQIEEEIPVNEIIKKVFEEVIAVSEEKVEPTLFTEPIIEKKSNLINLPHSEQSLHQKISENKQFDINERINESKVDSLKSAIGLNKKIAFVNELFNENTVEYAKSIDKLNSAIDLNEAMLFFNELKHQYSWSSDNENVIELEQLIQKRFR